MKLHRDSGWTRKGFSLLWDAGALARVVEPPNVLSIRQFFAMSGRWPDDLPGGGGDALVVAGVEGCLDALAAGDRSTWLEADLKSVVLSFQEEYEGQAALILWFPSGRRRIAMVRASEEYYWRDSSKDSRGLAIGRCLWAGAESDVERIIVSDAPDPDVDGDAFVGLYHPRIS